MSGTLETGRMKHGQKRMCQIEITEDYVIVMALSLGVLFHQNLHIDYFRNKY